MARAKIEQHSLYLMEQLVGLTGEAIIVSCNKRIDSIP